MGVYIYLYIYTHMGERAQTGPSKCMFILFSKGHCGDVLLGQQSCENKCVVDANRLVLQKVNVSMRRHAYFPDYLPAQSLQLSLV